MTSKNILWLDFETRSLCDLKVEGTYNYAMDISTEIICLCYALDDGPIKTLRRGDDIPEDITDHFGQIRAHNAAFDRLIMTHVLGIETQLEQWYCTATQARANCMPGALGDLARFAGLGMQKDYRGAQLIRALSIPHNGVFNEDPQLTKEMEAYCAQDVRVMRAASLGMRDLTEEELHDYHVNERINDLGVLVDVDLCRAAVTYMEDEKEYLEDEVFGLTDGVINSPRSVKTTRWVYERLGDEAKQLMEVADKDGDSTGKLSLDKNVRGNLLRLAEEESDQISPIVAEVLGRLDDLSSSSVAKFAKLAGLADAEDARVRGAFVFAGGAATGRASSYGAQVHNLPRKCAAHPEEVRAKILNQEPLEDVGQTLKSMLRPSFIAAPGHRLLVADWSAIEGRVNPWLSMCKAGDKKLQDYRDGLDPYKVNAAATYRIPYEKVTKEQRQVGKIQELALGYMGGAGAFDVFAKVYRVKMTPAQVKRAIDGWRAANPWAFEHGYALEDAYLKAMRHPGHPFSACRTSYLFDGTHLWYELPSGRLLCYPFAEMKRGEVTYRKASLKPKADAEEWVRGKLWPGLAIENLTQAAANDILRYALRELDDLYYRIVLHVHDEIVLEVPEEQVEQASKDLLEVMTTPPDWAEGLPLEVPAPDILTRYEKPD
jgi:DNA polymerase bacteriophage-type